MECSFESCLGENLLQKSGLLKDNVYLKICFDVFGDVSSRTSLAEQPYLRPCILEFASDSYSC